MIPLPVITQYASQVAGTPLTISCEADATFPTTAAIGINGKPEPLDGYVLTGANGSIVHIIHVRQSICDIAQHADHKQKRYPASYETWHGKRYDAVTGSALAVIEHEAMHISLQSYDEGLVDCTNVQNAWAFIKLFRLPSWIAGMVLQGARWHHAQMDPQYRTAC